MHEMRHNPCHGILRTLHVVVLTYIAGCGITFIHLYMLLTKERTLNLGYGLGLRKVIALWR